MNYDYYYIAIPIGTLAADVVAFQLSIQGSTPGTCEIGAL